MAPLHNSNSSQMQVNSDENDDGTVEELDRKWQSPPSSKKASARSPTMPRRSDPNLDFGDAVVEMSPTKNTSKNHHRSKSRSVSPRSMLKRGASTSKLTNLSLDMSVTSFTAFVDAVSPPPKMPHRRTSTCEDDRPAIPVISDGELGNTWHTVGDKQDQEEAFMGLNDANGPTEKKKIRKVRRNGGIQRAFSDSELSEASTINSQKESKKERKQSILQRRKARLAKKFLGRGKGEVPDTVHDEEDDDVVDTDKDLAGFTGITIKKKSVDPKVSEICLSPIPIGTDDVVSVSTKKTQGEIDVETRSRVSKSPIRFPGQDRSHSRGRARSSSRRGRASGSSVATGATGATEKTKKKKKKKAVSGSSVSRTKRRSNRLRASDDESEFSSDEEDLKPRASSMSRASKSPRRRRKSAGARKVKKGGRKPIPVPSQQVPLNDDGSQRTMTDLVINVPPTQDFVSPCTIGSGRRSVTDTLTPTNRSRDSKVSAITMSTGMFSPFTAVSSKGFNDDFSNHTDYTNSSLRGPQHIPDLEASEHQGSLLVKGNLSAVFETSSPTEGVVSTPPSDEMGGTPRTPRSSLRMPAVPTRRPSSDDHSLSSSVARGPLFDNSSRGEEDDVVSFDRFAAMTKQRSSSDLMTLERPTNMLRKASSERNVLASSIRSGADRVWRRGKKKPQKQNPDP